MTFFPRDSLNYLTTRKLYEDAADHNLSDFSVKLSSGSAIKVHSLILSTKSDVLANMINGNFKEKNEKTLQFPTFSDFAVEKFIRFLYGLEFSKHNVSMDVAMELLKIGEMYNVASLTNAAGVVIKDLLTKENVFDIWKFSKNRNDLNLMDKCGEFVVANFDRTSLLEDDKMKELPELSYWILKFENNRSKRNVIKVSAPRTFISFNLKKSVDSSLSFTTDRPIKVTGVGVSMLPGSSVMIEIKIGDFVHKTASEVVNNTNIDCVPVMFKEESIWGSTHVVKVSVTGSGAGITCTLDHASKHPVPNAKSGRCEFVKNVMCYENCDTCGDAVKFQITKSSSSSLIHEIYFSPF